MSRSETHAGVRLNASLTLALVWVHDVAVSGLCMAAVILVRYRFEPKPLPEHLVLRSTLAFAAVCAVVFPAFRLHRGLWRHTAAGDVVRIGRASAVAVLLVLPVLFAIDRLADFPRSTPFVLWPVLVVALSAGRLAARAKAHGGLSAALRLEPRAGGGAAVLVGSPAAAADYLGASRRRGGVGPRVLGLVTPEPGPTGRTVHGAEVLGEVGRLADLLRALAAAEGEPPQVVLAEPRPGRALLEAVVRGAAQAGCRVVRVRDGAGGPALGPVEAADLLDRPHHRLDPERARGLIAGRRVLVTGAGGTIGSELTRQALALGPERLVLYDSSEFNLYAVDQELRGMADAAHPGQALWRAVLGDVRDQSRLAQVFAEERPDVVLHAAALKHVPLMELNPLEAMLTNIGGAVNVAKLARESCEALVFISTDKAVNPTNVMGATKRVAERAVQAITAGGRVRTAVVRFGNVLGSTGSVVPLFERQIAEGGPVTVTHPEMVRWFMSVREAAGLVLQAAALPGGRADEGGRVFVLDMGEPVRIEDLARQLIGLHGLRPGVDIEIVHTGLRPGEKLSEEIFYDAETVAPTEAEGVLAAYDPAPPWSELEPRVADLLRAAVAGDVAGALVRLQALEPAFRRG